MDARSKLLGALLATAAATAPLGARACPPATGAPPQVDDDPRPRCAQMRAFPAWCQEEVRQWEERQRERVRRREERDR